MNDRYRWRALLAVLLACALLAGACGSDDDSDESGSGADVETDDTTETTTGESEDDSESETATAEEDASADDIAADQASGKIGLVSAINDVRGEGTPKPGGVLVYDWPSDIGTLDTITSSSFQTHARVGLVNETLFSFDTGPDIGATQQVIVPRLAESLDISDDGLTYTITLRQDVTWQDVAPVNGRPFTSADVKATFDLIKAEGFQSYMLERVETIEAPDDYTVVLNLSDKFAPLENYLANHHMWILPQEMTEDGFDRTQTAIGTGPFIMTSREQDVETVYERNPNYWKKADNGDSLPYLDGIRIVVIKDSSAAVAQFKAGQVDIDWAGISPEEEELLIEQYPEGQYFQWLDAGMGQVGLNMADEAFQNLNVRRAVQLAIDRDGMGQTIWGGGTVSGPIAPALADYALPEEERREYLRYDPDEAARLLAEAYPDGLEVTLIATTGYGAAYNRGTQWLIEDLTKAGFIVSYDELDYSTYFGSRWPTVDYNVQYGPQTPFLEPDEWLRAQLSTDGSRNWYNISDPTLDALLEEQLSLLDRDERIAKLQEIQRYVFENVMSPVHAWTYLLKGRYQPWVKGYYRHASYGLLGMEYTWLDK